MLNEDGSRLKAPAAFFPSWHTVFAIIVSASDEALPSIFGSCEIEFL